MRVAHILGPALAACAIVVSGCGSSAKPSGSRPSDATARIKFADCMRATGVPNFPDLGSNGLLIQGNGQTVSVNGVSVNAPAYQTARAKCQKFLPTSTTTSASEQGQQTARGLKFARCMRSHGVPNFPDPKVISHSDGNERVYLPGVNLQSPAVQAGAKACGFGPKGT